jgi:hypothetical protein
MANRNNGNPTMATTREPWTAAQNRHIVALAFELYDLKTSGASVERGVQSAMCRTALRRINSVGPDRTSYRNGKPRADSLNFKLQNVVAILAAMGRPEASLPGLPALSHTQKERANPLVDPMLWREIEITCAIRDAAASATA